MERLTVQSHMLAGVCGLALGIVVMPLGLGGRVAKLLAAFAVVALKWTKIAAFASTLATT